MSWLLRRYTTKRILRNIKIYLTLQNIFLQIQLVLHQKNVNTSIYPLAKYLPKIFLPISQSRHTFNITKHCIKETKKLEISMQKSLFTSVSFEKTTEIISQRRNTSTEINIQFLKKSTKELLLLCTKEVHFIYEDGIYQQNTGVTMVRLVGPILDRIFMAELETTVVPTLGNILFKWKHTYIILFILSNQ